MAVALTGNHRGNCARSPLSPDPCPAPAPWDRTLKVLCSGGLGGKAKRRCMGMRGDKCTWFSPFSSALSNMTCSVPSMLLCLLRGCMQIRGREPSHCHLHFPLQTSYQGILPNTAHGEDGREEGGGKSWHLSGIVHLLPQSAQPGRDGDPKAQANSPLPAQTSNCPQGTAADMPHPSLPRGLEVQGVIGVACVHAEPWGQVIQAPSPPVPTILLTSFKQGGATGRGAHSGGQGAPARTAGLLGCGNGWRPCLPLFGGVLCPHSPFLCGSPSRLCHLKMKVSFPPTDRK